MLNHSHSYIQIISACNVHFTIIIRYENNETLLFVGTWVFYVLLMWINLLPEQRVLYFSACNIRYRIKVVPVLYRERLFKLTSVAADIADRNIQMVNKNINYQLTLSIHITDGRYSTHFEQLLFRTSLKMGFGQRTVCFKNLRI